MRVVIAPDKFKGSLSASQVATHLGEPFKTAGYEVTPIPMADGGEGTVEAAIEAGFIPIQCLVTNPLGTPVQATYGWDSTTRTAVIEMALASGLSMTEACDDHAQHASSRGTGELIAHALDNGADQIILGVGGSASTDGGAGMLRAVGLEVYDAEGNPLPDGGKALLHVASVDFSRAHPRISQVRFTLAADVDNPLLGSRGAATVYGPQKGANPLTVRSLEQALTIWDRVLQKAGLAGEDAAMAAGAGAAGGVGYAALNVLNARRRAGVEVVLELTGFQQRARGAGLVITGEGSLDGQSLHGKTPMGVAQAARELSIPTIAVAGRAEVTNDQAHTMGFKHVYQLLDYAPDTHTAMTQAPRLLNQVGKAIIEDHVQEDS